MFTFLLVALLPLAATALALALARYESTLPGAELEQPAGPWIGEVIAHAGLPVSIEVVPAESPDAYYPNARTLALSERTFAGRTPRDWAIAAHELGHGLNAAAHPSLHALLPGARLVSNVAWRLCLAGLFAAAWMREPAVLPLAFAALLLSIAASAVVCADEVAASWHARRLIEASADPRGVRLAVRAMALAGSAYLGGALAQVAVALAWPLVVAGALGGEDLPLKAPSHLGIWLFLALVPVVVIRVMLSLRQAIAPEPVPSELDLWAMLARDSHWESLSALALFLALGALHSSLAGPDLAVAVAFAVAAALGPIYGLVAALTALPTVLWRKAFGEPRPARYPWRARDDVPRAMMALFDDPPWYLRAVWLLPLGYLPFVGLFAARLAG